VVDPQLKSGGGTLKNYVLGEELAKVMHPTPLQKGPSVQTKEA
jgi:hypothetical protein